MEVIINELNRHSFAGNFSRFIEELIQPLEKRKGYVGSCMFFHTTVRALCKALRAGPENEASLVNMMEIEGFGTLSNADGYDLIVEGYGLGKMLISKKPEKTKLLYLKSIKYALEEGKKSPVLFVVVGRKELKKTLPVPGMKSVNVTESISVHIFKRPIELSAEDKSIPEKLETFEEELKKLLKGSGVELCATTEKFPEMLPFPYIPGRPEVRKIKIMSKIPEGLPEKITGPFGSMFIMEKAW